MELFDGIVMGWAGWMLAMAWQVALLVAIVAVLDRLLRGRLWPPVRYAMWLVVLVKLILPPTFALPTGVVPHALAWAHERVLTEVDPRTDDGRGGGRDLATSEGNTARENRGAPATTGALGTPTAPAEDFAGRPALLPWARAAFLVWLAGMAVLVVALAARLARLRRWHREERDGRPVSVEFHDLLVRTARMLDLGRLPSVVFTDQLPAPAIFGLHRPILFLPARYLDELSPREAEHVLLHELGHIKRGDLWVNALALSLQIVYWFHPFVAFARRRLRDACEVCCDLTVARHLRERTDGYRTTLMATARRMLTESVQPGMGLLGIFEEPYRLVHRLRWLETRLWASRRPLRSMGVLVALGLVLFVLPMAGSSTSAALRGATPDAPVLGAGELPDARTRGSADESGPELALYIRDVTRTEAYLVVIRTESEVVHVNELWLGAGRVAQVDPHKTIVYAPADDHLLVINHDARTYVELPLPLELDAYLSHDLERRYAATRMHGVVEPTEKTRDVLERSCREYEVDTWETRDGRPQNSSSFQVWATTEAPGDLDLFHDFVDHLRLLYNRTGDACRDLKKIRGYQLRLASSEWNGLWRRRIINEAVELDWREPPADLFAVPADYRRRHDLRPEDLR